ncbi:MAG: type-F conjugative transfer system pilin assembly protein TrbC [Rhodospirillaceae bacterium]|nr:type-F conjugative transfer system pilin assembly protein TrbC [Rhodospirillaceae bacterium]
MMNKDNFHFEDSPMRRFRQVPMALFLAGMVLTAGCLDPVRADELHAPASDGDARRLADEVLRKVGDNDWDSLGAWSRSILDRALERAGEIAQQTVPGSAGQSTAPLPAERHAGQVAGDANGRGGTAEVLIFTSLSVPAASWRQWARDAARSGVPLVLRGVGEGGLPATAKRIGARLGGHDAGPGSGSGAGIAIDPRLFRLFGIERVPAVVIAPGGVPPCRSRGCTDDPAPPHDLVTGNIGLAAALEAVVDEGTVGRDIARRYLERLRGEDRP